MLFSLKTEGKKNNFSLFFYKSSILSLAKKLQGDNMKDEKTLKEVIDEICKMTGKQITKEQQDKIISTIVNDKVPENLDKMI